jgi:hypothetical protein
MDLPHSDDCFVAAFPAETTEAFLEGHVRAFAYFGGVPTRILYDNSKIAVARILGGEERQRTRAFSELQSYYLFADKFGRPAKGNDKGKVEGLVGYARRNFMVPIPRVSSWEELNTRLEAESRKRRLRRLRGHTETIGERFERDHRAMLPHRRGIERGVCGSGPQSARWKSARTLSLGQGQRSCSRLGTLNSKLILVSPIHRQWRNVGRLAAFLH